MRKINGRVLLYETGVPISNLIVAAYDIDPSGEPGRVRFRATDRLGSAVTNANGEFSIEFTEEDFYDRSDREGRPDIVIAIFPPEIAGADQPQESEPLYISSQTRIDAGREEGFAVFLPTQLLRERGIPLFPRPDTPETEDVQESLRRTIEERARAVSLVREALRPEMERRLTVRKSAKQQVARLMGGMPRPGTIADRFVPVGADAAPILKSARNAGIERLAAIKPRGMRLRLTPEMVEAFDLEIDDDGNLAGSQAITNAQFEEFFGHHLATPVLVIDPLLACRVEKQVKNFTDEAEPNTEHSPSTAADVSSAPNENDNLSSAVHDEILKQVQDTILAMAVDNDTGIGVRPNAGMIEKDLAVELTGGPADGPALHDFHNLQIAWDDVWTTIVDGRLAGKMAELYKKVVEVVDWGEANPDPSEIKELEQFLLNLEEAIETATGISEDISGVKKSPELFAWVPELEPKWNILSAFHREQMWSLYWTDQYDWESWKGKPFNREIWTIESHINSWDPGPPFLEYEYSPLIPLQRLWEIGQSHKEWLQYRIGDLHPNWGRNRALSILNQYQPVPGQAETPKRAQVLPSATLGRAKRLLKEIQKSLSEPYRFDVFKPCTHNFGIITTYRQRWQPQAYQVGELVGTLPLAPGEKRTYTKKRVIKTSRAQKEVEKALSSRSGESTETTRAEAEILRKASYSTNFKMTAEGGFSVGVVNANASSEYAANQALESSQKKRDFREAVRKAAQEYRNERTIEVSAEETFSDEFTETGEVSNVNDELTVTYLFYELQRRFEVSERLHKVTPVILVAFEVPAPNKIDEAWLLEHEWILRRVILDDELLTALDYLTDTFAGDELGVEVHRVHWQTQIQVVKELHETAALHSQARQTARSALKGAISTVASTGGGGVFDTVGDFLFGDDDADQTAAVEARRQAAQTALEWAEADMVAASERLSSAVSALQEATEAYTSALERRLNRRVSIDQLRLHVKQNILYYMQAIWLHEPSDQRYLRIYDKEIEWPEIKDAEVYLTPVSQHLNIPDIPGDLFESNQPQVTWVEAEMPPSVLEKTRKLHEVADIDNLLGFKGNYAIFPLTERNALTDYMMQSFLDSYFGVFDPDPFGEIPAPSEALEIARCAWKGASEEEKERITHWLVEVLNNQRRTSEIIIVPTEHLFIEALPGAHPLLEDFKLRHRKVDVQKARAEALQEKLEALRYAARIVKGELGDPDVETQIVGPDSLGVNVDTANAPDSSTELNSNS